MELHKNLRQSAKIADGKIVWYQRDRVLTLPASADNISRLNKLVEDRNISPIEAYGGRDHKDDRPVRQRIAEDGWSQTNKDLPKSKADILRDTLRIHREVNGKETYEEMLEREIRAAEIEEELAMEEAERFAKNAAQREHATWGVIELMYSDAPQAEVSGALKRLEIAHKGTSIEYKEAVEAFRKRQEENALIAKIAAEQAFAAEQAKYEARMSELSKSTWNEIPADTTTTTGESN